MLLRAHQVPAIQAALLWAERKHAIRTQMETIDDVAISFMLEHGPIAEHRRERRMDELRAAFQVAAVLLNDTVLQFRSAASELEGSEAVRLAAKVTACSDPLVLHETPVLVGMRAAGCTQAVLYHVHLCQ